MRLERFDLIRYGRFSGQAISLPRAARDFHVIVGANEAGKSTVRSAISDLLYGFPKSPPYAFLHAMSELRIGAVVEHSGQQLEFERAKGNKQTLRTPSDGVLADAALLPYLGTADRGFFEQMFGLDHRRLVEGGASMLSARNDVGQILFESASGVANLSRIRAALEEEADKLWSSRKSKDRAFYNAQEDYEQAVSALKTATARPKDWVDAVEEVERIKEELRKAQRAHDELDKTRVAFERIRRVAPHIGTLRAKGEELRQLGEVPKLPEDGARTLREAELVIGQAEVLHRSYESTMKHSVDEGVKSAYEPAVLELAEDINSLNALRLQFRAHENDIQRREDEVAAHWKAACASASELEWESASEGELEARLPSLMVRKSLERLIRGHGAVSEALNAAVKGVVAKERELTNLSAELKKLPVSETPFGLKTALAEARRLGDSAAVLRTKETEVTDRGTKEENALLALGSFRAAVDTLRAMTPPARETIQSFLKEQTDEDAETRALAKHVSDLRRDVKRKELEVAQYREAHDVVTREQVFDARRMRDTLWTSLKNDREVLQAQAPSYEQHVAQADAIADRREGTVQEASELQSKSSELARIIEQVAGDEAEEARLSVASTQRAARFEKLVSDCGLVGMQPDALTAWLDARVFALKASDAALEARRALGDWEQLVAEVASVLSRELAAVEGPVDPASRLDTLILQASSYIQKVDAAGGRRLALDEQESEAKRALGGLSEEGAHARADMDTWQRDWEQAVAQSGMLSSLDVGRAEGVLELVGRIDQALREMRKLRTERIKTMQADLAELAGEAKRLARILDISLEGLPAADIAISLTSRLKQASEARDASVRLKKESLEAKQKADTQLRKIEEQHAALRPLLERGGVTSLAELHDAIARSDGQRRILHAMDEAKRGLADGGDGLTQEQLESEVDGADLATLPAVVNANTAQINELIEQQKQLSAALSLAKASQAKFAGSDDAARSEAKRQEALAKMSDAVERYIKVATAAHLLKWSIDRYRETKQGPMLKRAAAIFSKLTLGSFELLTIDTDHEPPLLQGKRPGGEFVGVDGMSDGARDQLYLALRLAALDMHLGHAHALPFIADDLVINYDDKRSRAAIEALGELSRKTQVLFLTHHDHLLPLVRDVLGSDVNVVQL